MVINQIIFTLLLVFLTACAQPPSRPVTVFAAASLREVITDVTTEWSRESGRAVRLQFDASSTLARQIREGATADVFISADSEWAAMVHAVDSFEWIGNRLVCVAPKEVADVDLRTVRSLALAGENVPAGRYALLALGKMGIRLPARVIYGSNVRDVLAKVSSGGAEAGIVYATDVQMDSRVHTVFVFPEESHPPIVYVAVLINPEGRDFFQELQKPRAMELAVRRGFKKKGTVLIYFRDTKEVKLEPSPFPQ